ncbi:uncharacterized protein LOC130688851 [Daphnia carinata]|uniref:uncharacterized protein LOC130688851 n=1 Tax=Daphnia carinata TaxID=120202 RepID=UPI00257BA091|nr:uncharacterized protein LOC130688851 [Daphnia carinata]
MQMAIVRRKTKTLMLWAIFGIPFAYVIIHAVLPVDNHVPSQVINVDWRHVDMDTLNGHQLTDYFSWSNSGACRLVQDFGGVMISVGNIPAVDGQKAVCLDRPHLAPSPDECIVYSFGINNEWSFDEAMEQYGCNVFAFDPSMNVSDHDRSEWIRFYRLGLGSKDGDTWNGQSGVETRTLDSIHNMLKSIHRSDVIDYLKLDIETAEWAVLPQIVSSGMMDKVKQLSVEIHLPNGNTNEEQDNEPFFSLEEYRRLARILQSLENYGLVRFDSKRNPWSVGVGKAAGLLGIDAPYAYEIAWFNNKLLQSQL